MGILFLAAVVEKAGHEVRVLDLQAGDKDPSILESTLRSFDPTLIGLSSTSPSHLEACQIARQIRAFGCEATIVKGGVHETHCARTTLQLNPAIDFCMVGECDSSFLEFVEMYHDPTKHCLIPQLAFRNGRDIVVNPSGSQIILDDLPPINRSLLGPEEPYNFLIFGNLRTAQVQTMRGCPFTCSFCNQRNRNPLVRSPEKVVEELIKLRADGCEGIFFDDATFTVNQKRTAELMRLIAANRLSMKFACQTRAELVSQELADLMAAAGFCFISFGLETADPVALTSVMKSKSPARHISAALAATEVCRNASIMSCLNLIAGFEGETLERLQVSFEFAAKANSTYVSLSSLARYPHEDPTLATLYERGVNREPIWQKFDEGYGSVHPHMTPDYAESVITAATSFLGTKLDVT